jgi:hypothetical protein
MPTFTLEQLGDVVEKKFAPTIIQMGEAGNLVMRSTVNLSDEETAAMAKLQRAINAVQGAEEPKYLDENNQPRPATPAETQAWEDEQLKIKPKMVAILHEMIYLAAGEKGRPYAEKFFELKGQELGWLLALVQEWGKAAQLGEPSASSSS